ncbi:hypothetical protein AMS68_000106 [Peltaster fructicola]|uniref:RING-type E3 ubiquitin transferase n=1 Tax=Peltaster fructicola TaxID=286661 RepID=A0A6H0XIX7_9PEZI|nr:hypothetical protein AMS68_000106 [Peltaster fructicola]
MMIPTASPGTTTQTAIPTTSPASPTRPSRLRGLSYLRTYTQDRLLSRSDAPPLIRSTSSPNTSAVASPQPERREEVEQITPDSPTMARNRAATTSGPTPAAGTNTASSSRGEQHPTIRFIPHVEARSSRPSLHFPAISKTLKSSNGIIRVGRYTEREQAQPEDNILPIGFKSKVVSRRHCEFWCDNGQWYVKDVKSSSGTFLNHVRLSSPGVESRPYPVNDGDVVQLGIDFKGGEEVIFRCVKIRIECNRGWQKALNNFNTATHKKLLNSVAGKSKRDSDAASVSNHECSICLNPVAPCQCLFVAPCGHVWHYKCIRALLNNSSPNFLCPNCRYVADLDADVEPPVEDLCEESEHGKIEQIGQSSSDEAMAGASGNDAAQLQSDASAATDSDHAETADSSGTPLRTPPGFIPIRPKTQASTHDTNASPTTGATAAFALAAGMVADGLLTPRNDAGPFVLDGSAGRGNSARDGMQAIDEHIART